MSQARPKASASGKDAGTTESAGEDVAETTRLYQLLADNAREMVSRHDFDLTVLYASPAASRVLGFTPEDLVGHRLDDLVHSDDLAGLVSCFALARDSDQPQSTLFRIRAPDRSWRWCEAFLRAAGDDPSEIHATIHDITKYKQIEKAIERVAKEWRGTFDSARDAIIMLDRHARVVRVNRATTRFLQCEFSDLLGRDLLSVIDQYLALDDPFGISEAWSSATQSRHDVKLRDQTWVRSSIDPVTDSQGDVTGAVLFISDITVEKKSEFKLRDTLEQLRNLSSHLQVVREEERKSIAREVHDELGHALTALKMDIAWLTKQVTGQGEELVRRAQSMTNMVDQTIATVRRISTELRPPILDDLGLVAALEWLLEDYGTRTGITTTLALPDVPDPVTGEQASTIFRIVQEALTNVARHADASRVDVKWAQDDQEITLTIDDDGRGFDSKHDDHREKFGLLGIAERARDLGGVLEIDSKRNQGTTLQIRFPRQVAT